MKITLFHLLLFAALLTFITNMEVKGTKMNIPVKTRKDLMSKVWRVEQVLVNNAVDQTADFKNSRYDFKSEGTYIFNRKSGQVKGTWELVKDEQKLILDKNTPHEKAVDILLISDTQLHLAFLEKNQKGDETYSVYKLSF